LCVRITPGAILSLNDLRIKAVSNKLNGSATSRPLSSWTRADSPKIQFAGAEFPDFSGGFQEASIAQTIEQLICNQQVVGSNPTAGSLQYQPLT
jgi:hypothetical protein